MAYIEQFIDIENRGYVHIVHCRLSVFHFTYTYGYEMFLWVSLAKPLNCSVKSPSWSFCWSLGLRRLIELKLIVSRWCTRTRTRTRTFRWWYFHVSEFVREWDALIYLRIGYHISTGVNETTNNILTFRGIVLAFTLAIKIHTVLKHWTRPRKISTYTSAPHHTF